MIINNEIIEEKYVCNKHVAEYLIFKCHIPLLGYGKTCYYFANTNKLKEAIKNMPLWLKIISHF